MRKLGAWVDVFRPQPTPRLRVLCIPFAGAGSSVYQPWRDCFGDDVEVCAVALPGRWSRIREPLCRSMDEIISGVADNVAPTISSAPWVLFGHSMGAAVGFELLRAMRARGLRMPERFYASGRGAPHLPNEAFSEQIHRLSDNDLVERIDSLYGGMDPRIRADKELMDSLIPILRADFEVLGTYRYREGEPLSVPITALGGKDDPLISESGLQAWSQYTAADFEVRHYAGRHFFLTDDPKPLLADLRRDTAATLQRLSNQ